mmetsp:Transcript_21123/g.35994  ORF Transcript_21123/g.35994 Transcript_21123/m.35994 type:complete len:129 (-) Transcript_21123:458-844(-)
MLSPSEHNHTPSSCIPCGECHKRDTANVLVSHMLLYRDAQPQCTSVHSSLPQGIDSTRYHRHSPPCSVVQHHPWCPHWHARIAERSKQSVLKSAVHTPQQRMLAAKQHKPAGDGPSRFSGSTAAHASG